MVKKIVRVLVMAGVIAVATTATQALQADEQQGQADSHLPRSIVGSWVGTFDDGAAILMSFTSDGIVLSSVQTEVSLTNPILTPGHGAWTQVGDRQFAITDAALLYDIRTGEYLGAGKLHLLLTLDRAGNLAGPKKAEFFDPAGNSIGTRSGTLQLTRVIAEPFEP